MKNYILNVLGALTQGLNTILGGDRDQSFSSRSYEAMLTGKWWGRAAVTIIDALFYPFDGKGHCEQSYNSDTERTYTHG